MGWFARAGRRADDGTAAGRRGRGSGTRAESPDPRTADEAAEVSEGDTIVDVTDAAAEEARRTKEAEDARRAAELSERFRARRARAEAEAELRRLRRRHWSGERVIEEGRVTIEWWEHPDADPYAVLGLLPGASLQEASSARRRIAYACHPDRVDPDTFQGDEAVRRMVAANSAYERLRRALRPVEL
ncbi:MAG: J domain-containing protein [Acidimicrobiia bacterium]